MKIKRQIIKQLLSHAKKEAPLEACGYLAAKDGVITSAYKLINIDHSTEHFSFDPKEQFETMRDVRAKDLELVAVYHSHPASPARPSNEDIKLAYDPNLIYVIVSLLGGKEDIKAFHIRNQNVDSVSLEVIDG